MLPLHSHLLQASKKQRLLAPGKSYRLSPTPYWLSEEQLKILIRLGPALHAFQKTLNLLYRQSWQGKVLPQIAQLLDAGKPEPLVEAGRQKRIHNDLPHLIRPDLIVTEQGFALCEIDSVPGGVGITAWLQETYAPYFPEIIGAPDAMRRQFRATFGDVDLVISEEAIDYRPEWEWFLGKDAVHAAETYHPGNRAIYRFFEAFDYAQFSWLSLNPPMAMQPPLKPHLEEKLALALFWLKPLEPLWRQYLGSGYFELLRSVIPRTWVLTDDPVPWHATIPGLEVQDWREVGTFSQKQRRLVLKISGYDPRAWGARGVVIGHDVSSETWQAAINRALEESKTHPWVLQSFIEGKLETHSFYENCESGAVMVMKGRTRLCPYYFSANDRAVLAGILATHCPADKKVLHGMSEAILAPCGIGKNKRGS